MNKTLKELQSLVEKARIISQQIYSIQEALTDALENETLDILEFNDPTNLDKADLDLLEISRSLYSMEISKEQAKLERFRKLLDLIYEQIENLR